MEIVKPRSLMNKHESYFLKTGQAGLKRLNIVNEIYNGSSRDFLQENGVANAMNVLEVGGGLGDMSLWMASQIQPNGRITILDSSSKQINIVKSRIQARKIHNIDLYQSDVSSANLEDEFFDLIYCRFLLIHSPTPHTILANLVKALKPGGKVILEDCIFSHSRCYPYFEPFERRLEIIKDLFSYNDKDFDLGMALFSIVNNLGLTKIKSRLVHPILNTSNQKFILPMFLEETSDSIIDMQISDKGELSNLNKQLIEGIIYNDKYLISSAEVCQISATKV